MSKPLNFALIAFAMVMMNSVLTIAEDSKEAETEAFSKRILGNWEGTMSIDDKSLKKFMTDNNVPENVAPLLKKQIEAGKVYFAFQQDGTAKAGIGAQGRVKYSDSKWKVKNEKGNHAEIVITDDKDKSGTLDATFQKDGTIVGKLIPPDTQKVKAPDITLTMKRVEKLPEETKPTPPKTETKEEAKPE